MSHMSPDFAPVFGDCIRMIRQGHAAGFISGSQNMIYSRVCQATSLLKGRAAVPDRWLRHPGVGPGMTHADS